MKALFLIAISLILISSCKKKSKTPEGCVVCHTIIWDFRDPNLTMDSETDTTICNDSVRKDYLYSYNSEKPYSYLIQTSSGNSYGYGKKIYKTTCE